ncbi:MAG: hypothetical protein AAFW64_02650 [Pseudomonadota bacterium]
MTGSATFTVFPADAPLAPWIAAARARADVALGDPSLAQWWRAEKTWFVGVDALANNADGAVAGVRPAGRAITAARQIADGPWHPMQVSAVRPGYPGTGAQDNPAQHRFRLQRDGAHLDGLLPVGPNRRRHLREPHGFLLGLALTQADADASPLVVWDGSEEIIRDAFTAAFAGHDPEDWAEVDVTEAYKAARRRVFDTCPRRTVPLAQGEGVLVHRMAIHGIAPWGQGTKADPMGRVMAYLRPRVDPLWWLTAT